MSYHGLLIMKAKVIFFLAVMRNLAFLVILCFASFSTSAASCDGSTGTISSSCTDYSTTISGLDVSIPSGVTVTPTANTAPAVGITQDTSSLTISGSADGSTLRQGVVVGIVNNAGTGTGKASLSSLQNFGTIKSTGSSAALLISQDATPSPSIVSLITNSGTIENSTSGGLSNSGIRNLGTITNLINTGTISGGQYGINNAGTITTITNTGTITGVTKGINNSTATIGTINNAGTLTYTGTLPTNYNVIINSPTSFGTFASATGASASAGTAMKFGIYSGSSVTVGNYSSVLTGTYATDPSTVGTFGIYSWTLANQLGSAIIWDLTLSLATNATTNTQSSISALVTPIGLQGMIGLQTSALVNGLNYDCSLFDMQNICISTGARYTNGHSSDADSSSGILVLAYRINENLRVGAFIDQGFSNNYSNSIAKTTNNLPLAGTFIRWSQNTNGTGVDISTSLAVGRKNVEITRPIISNSEPGSGSTALQSQGIQMVTKYGYGITEDIKLSPYFGARYSSQFMNAYTESSSSSVTAPLSYDALKTSAITTLVGMQVAYFFTPHIVFIANTGLESSIRQWGGALNANSSIITGLSTQNFYSGSPKNMPTNSLGLYYDVGGNQRLGMQVMHRKEAYGSFNSTSAVVTYTAGL